MSPFFKKIASLSVAVTLASQNLVPFSAFAEAKTVGTQQKTSVSAMSVPETLKSRMKIQKAALQKSGKLEEYADARIKWDDASSKPSQIRGLKKKASADVAADVSGVLNDLTPLFGTKKTGKKVRIENGEESAEDRNGGRHVRLEQSFSWIEIIGGDLVAHVDDNGNLTQIDGDYVSEVAVDTAPKIKASKALVPAIAKHVKKDGFKLTSPKLAILSEPSGQNLVWSYEAAFEDGQDGPSRIRYDVDAQTGKVIRSYDVIKHGDSPATVRGNLLQSEGGNSVTLSGTYNSEASKYYIFDGVDRMTFVYNISTNSGTYVDSEDIASRTVSDWGTTDPTEISAGYNLQKTLDFFRPFGFWVEDVTFSSTGQTMAYFAVHYGNNYNNAFWSPGNGFYFWDGDGVNMSALTTLDVVAHEFGHAWTESTSNLVYLNEPGALNESFSDIAGVTVELVTQADDRASYPNSGSGKADWLIGEDIYRIPGKTEISMRDMRDPANSITVGTGGEQPTKYKGTYWYSGTADNGGVHQNSGVQNFFYYLLSEGGKGENDGLIYSVDGIGLANAWSVAYAANSYYVVSDTDYQSARQAWIDAANSINPAWAASVASAWDAVGVFEKIDYPAFLTADESFESGASLPAGWTTDAGTGAWTVSTSTGAFGNNSLVSANIDNSGSTNVVYGATTESGYLSFHARTSSERNYDFLKFYVDWNLKWQWSGTNAWMPLYFEIGKGTHEFKWTYAKDEVFSSGLDEVWIDAVHVETATGGISIASATGTGNVYSKNGLSAVISMDGTGTYLFEDRNLDTIVRGTASGTAMIPLSNASEGNNTVRFQYRNGKNFVSSIVERTFFVDGVAPSAPSFEPASVSGSSQNVDIRWTATSDSGSGLPVEPYSYEISQDAGFVAVTASGFTSATGVTVSLPEGYSYARVTAYDIAGNASSTSTRTAFVDSVAPDAPTEFKLNADAVIWTGTVSSVTLEGLAGTWEITGTVHYEVADRSWNSLSGTLSIGNDGRFSTNLDLTAFSDGMIDYSAFVVDAVGNTGAVALASVGKSVVPADGAVEFLSGSHVGGNTATVRISAVKTVDYEITGDVASTVTGSISGVGSDQFDIALSAGDGEKTVLVSFTDTSGTVTYAQANVTVDTVAPTVSVVSHADGSSAEGTGITLTGSAFDAGGIATFTVGGQSMPVSNGNWTKNLALSPGDNVYEAVVTDHVGLSSSALVTITRTPTTSNVRVTDVTGSWFVITFDTDVSSLGSVAYGTDSNSLSTTVSESSSGTSHSLAVTGLSDDVTYYAKTYASVNGKDGTKSALQSVKTPKTATSAQYGDAIVATGSVWFEESTSTGAEFGSASGSVTVYSEDGKHSASFALGGLVIGTTGWDGKFGAPKTVTVSGSVSETGYSQTGSVYAIGNDSARLAFSGKTVTVRVDVGNALNGKTLRAYHSNDGVAFDFVTTCVVSAGVCEFEADRFSYYAFAAPSDSVPDTFAFAPKSGAEFSVETVSDPVTLTGFNVPAQITVNGGSYSINNAAFMTGSSTVNSGDVVRVKLTSSSVSLGSVSATLSAWGVNATFTVTSKQLASGGSSSSSSSSGGGGGGGGWSGWSSTPAQTTKSGAVTWTGNVVKTEPKKNVPSTKKNVVTPSNPLSAASDIAKTGVFAKMPKTATSKNVPFGAKPKIDRLVTDRIVASLKLEGKSAEAKSEALAKAAASVSKLAKSKTKGGERAILSYVSEQLSKKAAEAKKPAKKKNVRKPVTNK